MLIVCINVYFTVKCKIRIYSEKKEQTQCGIVYK